MTQPGNTIQKIIAIFFIIWGVGVLSYEIFAWYKVFQIIHISRNSFSILSFIKNYHPSFLAPLLTLVSGVMLLLINRIGWILGVCVSIFIPFGFLAYPSFYSRMDTTSFYIIFSMCVLFLTVFILLISKPIRLTYFPNKVAWSSIIIIFILLMTDKILVERNNIIDENRTLTEIRKQYELDSIRKSRQMSDSTKR